jgi:GNAT superfamily N-acetyltransferase
MSGEGREPVSGLTFEVFPATDPARFAEYLRIKYQVFVEECGWSTVPSDRAVRMAAEDEFDTLGQFVLARELGGMAVGIARGIRITNGFPHRALFESHLRSAELAPLANALSTINALAVRKEHRGTTIAGTSHLGKVTVARMILVELIGVLRDLGARIVFVSADSAHSVRVFSRLGFYVIDPAAKYAGAPREVVNMALLTNDAHRFRELHSPLIANSPTEPLSSPEVSASAYFQAREDTVRFKIGEEQRLLDAHY